MNVNKHYIALLELLLILPAALFMASLVLRGLPATGLDVAAQHTVMWYAGRQWTLWLLLVTLPFGALVVGCATLLKSWEVMGLRTAVRNPQTALQVQGASVSIVALTCVAGVILAIVGLHILAN
jgi:hypothetical protein